jgi:hypothetical protein
VATLIWRYLAGTALVPMLFVMVAYSVGGLWLLLSA